MSRKSPDSDDWDQLIAAVKRGHCVVMLGPHAVTARYDRDSPPEPIGVAFARFLSKQIEDELGVTPPVTDETSVLAEAAVKNGSRDLLHDWVRNFYDRQDDFVFDKIIATLSELNVQVVVNLIPGLPLERAFEAQKPELKVAFYDRNGPESKLIEGWGPGQPLVYHLNGSLIDPPSLALTDNDLLDVLVSVVGGDPKLPENLVSTLSDVTGETTYLFLGFRLYLWQHRVLMHVLDEAMGNVRRKNKSFAFEVDEIYPETRNFFTVGHKISLFDDVSPLDFAAELTHRMGETGDEPVSGRAPFPDKVFICHASEDRQTAATLAAELKASGLTPWLDKDRIYGGAEWDELVQRALRKDVQYVVILRSKNFVEKSSGESYLNREIDAAVDRSKSFPDGSVFIIPVFIDDDRTEHTRLDEFQWIDYQANGVAELVSTIKRDIQLKLRS